jgi:hypothetical protein
MTKNGKYFRDRFAGVLAWCRTRMAVRFGAFLFFLYFAVMSIGFHNKVDLADWKSTLKADAAGYYIYLPGLFHHGFRSAGIKDEVAEFAAHGFTIDRARDRIITKYTCGVAYFQLPGYLVAEMIEGYGVSDGWTRTHHQTVQITGVALWVLGLCLVAAALRRWRPTRNSIALIVLACVAFGTNSFYYAFRSPGYSHVYSFFLVALAMYCIYADEPGGMWKRMRWTFVGANALLFLIRPVDAIAVLALYGLLWTRHPYVFRSARLYLEQVGIGLLICLPQLAYWKYVHGTWIHYSYVGEGFSNWASPMFAEVLMAPRNGLMPHSPAYFLLPFCIAALFLRDRRVGLLLLIAFVSILYSCAAWHDWQFGCGYGMRPLVQYTPFLAMGLWVLFSRIHTRLPALWHSAIPILVLVCFINYRAMLEYDACYIGHWWEWEWYTRNILKAFLGKAPC